MRPILLPILLLALAAPAWAGKKATIEELKSLLVSMRQDHKSDSEVANRLKEIDLAEQLTPTTREALQQYALGPLTTEQFEVLQGRTAFLPPPPSEIPSTLAPDEAAQRAILARAIDYVTKTYMHSPHVEVSRTTARFQDGINGIPTNSGMTNNMGTMTRSWEPPNMFMRYIGAHTEVIESEKGLEIIRPVKQKQPWGQNGQISEGGPGPVLSIILQEAATAGNLKFIHWEIVRGHTTAVFSFQIPKKKASYVVHYCCFPITEDAGRMGYEGTGANLQYGTTWKDFKTAVGYHGEFFVEPDSGVIDRVITHAELKPTDFVHQEDMRIDYGPVLVEGKPYVLPVDRITLNEVVPNGDNYAARYSIRHTLFHETYTDCRPFPAK